jgi:hypothetical protein
MVYQIMTRVLFSIAVNKDVGVSESCTLVQTEVRDSQAGKTATSCVPCLSWWALRDYRLSGIQSIIVAAAMVR